MTLALTVTDINQLNSDDVSNLQSELAELIAEQFPNADLTRGVVHDVILYLGGLLADVLLTEVENVRESMSLMTIEANPALATDSIVDAVLSNFGITRLTGSAASGQVTVLLDAMVPVTVPAGAAFTINGQTFATSQAYAVRVSAAQVTSSTDLVLTPAGNNQYAFSVPVTAAEVGLASMVTRGASATPAFVIPHFVAAYVESDFTGGVDPENNAALIARMQAGIAAKTIGGRANIDALVHAQSQFANVLQLSSVGAGDPEMIRDQHTIFPLSCFGRADIYIRSAALPAAVVVSKTATLVGVTTEGGVWQFPMLATDAPGFYEITSINLPGDLPSVAGFPVTSDVRGYDLTVTPGWAPDIVHPIEAVYSAYQTAVIQFTDNRTSVAGLTIGSATASYNVTVSAMPQIADLQNFLGGRDVRSPAGDVLVKAPIPCFLVVSFTIRTPTNSAVPNVPAIQAAVASAVNALGFCGRLHYSNIVAAIIGLLPNGASLDAIDMFGRIRQPDGTITFIRDPLSIAINPPTNQATMTSGRTVCYYLSPTNVAVTTLASDIPLI